MTLIKRVINSFQIVVDANSAGEFYLEPSASFLLSDNSKKVSIDRLLYFLSKENVVPLYLKWELTDKCNMSCEFCYIHNHSFNNDVSLSTSKPYLDWLIENGLLFVLLTGGECTLNNDFIEIYRYLKSKGVFVVIYTNGTNINDDIISSFIEYRPYRIEISLYEKYSYDSIVYKNVLKLKNLGLDVVCKVTVNKITYEIFHDIQTWCTLNNVRFYYSTEMFDAYDGTQYKKYELDIETRSILERARYTFDEIQLIESNRHSKTKLCLQCGGGSYVIYINSGFELSICPGIALRIPLNDIAMDKAYNTLLDYIKEYKDERIINCNGCKAHIICRACLAKTHIQHNNVTNKHECIIDPAYCDKVQKLYNGIISKQP